MTGDRRRRRGAPSAHPTSSSDDDTSLPRVLATTAPAVALLVWLLAPWDRARLRQTCRALADAVPAAACAPTLSAMVQRAGGAGLLRYGAGDARPCWVHALIAVETDAADALRWLLGQFPMDRLRARELRRLALLTGSAAAWRIVEPLEPRDTLTHALLLAGYAAQGGSESLAAECAAKAAVAAASEESPDDADTGYLETFLHWVERRNLPAALAPFLRVGEAGLMAHDDYGRRVALLALGMGRRDLAEPCDWQARHEPQPLLEAAVRGGDVAMAEALLSGAHVGRGRALLWQAVQCTRGMPAMAEWVLSRMEDVDPAHITLTMDHGMLARDAVDALRWLVERHGYAPTAAMLDMARQYDAVACAAYLGVVLGIRPTTETLCRALTDSAYRVAAHLAADVEPLDARAFVHLVAGVAGNPDRGTRAMALLRRRALLPAPDPVFLGACLCSLRGASMHRALAAAGYRVDADEREWVDSVRPHCAGTPLRQWRPLAYMLRDRYESFVPETRWSPVNA